MVVIDDVGRLAADLGRFLDELPVELGASRAGSAERHGRKAAQARTVRRERLEQYVDAMTTARRLRLAGALHLLSLRLDEDLAHPDQRERAPADDPAPSQPGGPRVRAPRATAPGVSLADRSQHIVGATASATQRRSVADPRIAIAAKR